MEEVQENLCSSVYRGQRSQVREYTALSDDYYQPNNKLVWEEAILVINDLFDNVWGDKKEVVVEHILDIFMPVSSYRLVLSFVQQ